MAPKENNPHGMGPNLNQNYINFNPAQFIISTMQTVWLKIKHRVRSEPMLFDTAINVCHNFHQNDADMFHRLEVIFILLVMLISIW